MLYFIPTPIGNLADISLRSLKILSCCEFAFCEDTRVSKSLISLLNAQFNAKISIKNFISFHTHNEKQVLSELDVKIFEKNVAYLSDAGMPCISDPGLSLMEFALKNNIAYEVLPGANAALVALVSSALCQKEFIFLGFLANKGQQRQKDLEKLLQNPYPSVVYESPKRILSLVEYIAENQPKRELFVMKEISKKFQNSFRGKADSVLKALQEVNLNGEWVLVLSACDELSGGGNLLCERDILALDLPLKTKSKLLAKLSGKNSKELYQKLLLSQN